MPSLTFVLTGQDHLSPVFDEAGDAAQRFRRRVDDMSRDASRSVSELNKSLKSLVPAAVPAAASLAPIAAGAGTVAVALAAMGAAMGPQIAKMNEAADAQKAWRDAVGKSGARSEAAVTAQREYLRQLADMPPATREAAVGLGLLKDNYEQWSDSLAGDTMAPLTKGVGIVNSLLPKTSGLVKVTSTEADRLMTILGGQLATPGLDAANTKFTAFAERTLSGLNDQLVHLLRISDGQVGGNVSEFMEWARAQGPAVSSVVRSIATALLNVLEAGSETGVGLLQVVEVLAKLVAAVPPGALAAFLQLALAMRVVKTAALGLAATRAALAVFGTQLVTMHAAAAAAPGALAGVSAAIATLSRTTKIALAGTGIGLLLIALSELSDMGETAPPDVDKLTTSLGNLGRTGTVSGYAAEQFGANFEKLREQIGRVTDPSVLESINNWGAKVTGGFLDAGDATEEFTKSASSIDDSLANLVRNGNADLAKAALADMMAGMSPEKAARFREELDGFDQALADLAFEQRHAAEAQGLFGAQAQSVQAKLAAQKASADGLRQSIEALNDANRNALGGMIGFEASIDAAAKAARENAGSLRMVNGQLDVNSPRAQAAATALNDLSAKTKEAAASARESGASWQQVNGIYKRGHDQFIKNAQAMGLTRKEAEALAKRIANFPDKTAMLKGDISDLRAKVEAAKARLKTVPPSKQAAILATIRDLEAKIASAKRQLDNLDGKTATTFIQTVPLGGTGPYAGKPMPKIATGGLVGYPGGGYISGPGTGTSDSIMAMVSNGEYVVRAKSVDQYGVAFLNALNEGRLGVASGSGSMGGAGRQAAAGLALGLTGARATVEDAARVMAAGVTDGIRAELQIASPSKKTKALAHDVGKGFILGLTGSRDRIREVARDLAQDVRTAFSGKKESALLAFVTRETQQLLAVAAKRDKVAATIAAATGYANTLIRNAREGASLSSLGMEPDQVTAGGIKGGLASKLAQIKQFTRYIDILAKRGLNKSLLRQILNMGPEQGYAYASALVGADKVTFKQINSLQSQIDKSAKGLGRLGADALYDSGKNASKGFLTGLQSQQKAIEDFMVKIAKGMQAAIKKALGIKSPSTVMAAIGAHSTEGLARGLVAGLPAVDRSLGVVSGRIAGIQPVMGRAAVTGARGGGTTVINLNVEVRPGTDATAVWSEIRRGLLELKRTLGGVELGLA